MLARMGKFIRARNTVYEIGQLYYSKFYIFHFFFYNSNINIFSTNFLS